MGISQCVRPRTKRTTSPSTATPSATTSIPTGTTTTPQGGIEETALLTDVRAARHEGFDRIVFQFGNVLPGYDVRYISRPLRQDGSGSIVPIAGSSVVQIRMHDALDADMSQASAPLTYTGPQRFTPGTPEVVELVRSGGFEGVLTWVARLRDAVGGIGVVEHSGSSAVWAEETTRRPPCSR